MVFNLCQIWLRLTDDNQHHNSGQNHTSGYFVGPLMPLVIGSTKCMTEIAKIIFSAFW